MSLISSSQRKTATLKGVLLLYAQEEHHLRDDDGIYRAGASAAHEGQSLC
jgi:hypothetical protein